MPVKTSILVFLSFSCIHLFSQENLRFTSYNTQEGIPQSTITSLMEDRYGFLWIGCGEGLCRYDGYNFKVYKHNKSDSNSISSVTECRFFKDSSGNLWAAHKNGISFYDDKRDCFKNIVIIKPKNGVDGHTFIYGEDEKYIWAGITSDGLVKIDKHSFAVRHITTHNKENIDESVYFLEGFIDKGKIWFSTEKGIMVYHIATNNISIIKGLPSVLSMLNFNDRQVFTFTNTMAVYIDKATLQYTTTPIHIARETFNIFDIRKESEHLVRMCCLKGLFYFDTDKKLFTKHIEYFDNDHKNAFANAYTTYTDKSGNLWIGTNGDGLKKITNSSKKFRHYNSYSGKSNIVKSIYADSSKLYVGYYDNGIDVFDRKKGFEKNINVSRFPNAIVNHAFHIVPFTQGNLLVNTSQNNGLYKYTITNGIASSIFNQVIKSKFYSNDLQGGFLYRCSNGRILTTNLSGLVCINGRQADIIGQEPIPFVANKKITTCFEDSRQRLWIGSTGEVFYQQGNEWISVAIPNQKNIKNINEDNDGNIWLATSVGIYILDKNRKLAAFYNEENGLADEFIYGILKDELGNMWCSHNRGLSVFKVKEKIFVHYTYEDGLQSNEFNGNAFFKAADGELFFGGINGTNSFFAKDIVVNKTTPKVQITSIAVNDSLYKTDSTYWNTRYLTLPYTDNNVSFEFVLPEFSNPLKNRYAYMLSGIDKNWSNANDIRFVRYPNMHSGHYTFRVKAANNDGVWGKETIVEIDIIPPFWQTWWFYILTGLVAFGLLIWIGIFIQQYRQRRQLRTLEMQQKIQLERERISRDLHDNVGTQLSLMSRSIDNIILPLQPISNDEKEMKMLLLSQSSKEVINILRESIWILNKDIILIEEFWDKVKAFSKKQIDIFATIHLEATEELLIDTMYLQPGEAIHLFRICQEAVSNAIKYSNATTIKISLQVVENKYIITIQDNGIGFNINETNVKQHYGLGNMQSRADEIAATIDITSIEGKGTTILLQKK